MLAAKSTDSRHSSGQSGSAGAIHRLLLEVESHPSNTVGALVVERGSERVGAVLVERGRVCWAVAAKMPRRLSELLVSRSTGLDTSRLEDAYRRCRASGQPFGESLVDDGLISADGLRDALASHTIDGLAVLAGRRRDTRRRWLSRDDRSYDPRFTFSTVELAARAGALENASQAVRARAVLDATLPPGVSGASVYRRPGAGRPLLVAHAGFDADRLGCVDALCRWSITTMDLCGVFANRVNVATASLSNGATHVAWRDDALLHVAACRRAKALAKLLGRLHRRR